tara:strand:+ start:6933 stop:7673 length:741 start_codon:yes stop_codon:yes gene_type:complete
LNTQPLTLTRYAIIELCALCRPQARQAMAYRDLYMELLAVYQDKGIANVVVIADETLTVLQAIHLVISMQQQRFVVEHMVFPVDCAQGVNQAATVFASQVKPHVDALTEQQRQQPQAPIEVLLQQYAQQHHLDIPAGESMNLAAVDQAKLVQAALSSIAITPRMVVTLFAEVGDINAILSPNQRGTLRNAGCHFNTVSVMANGVAKSTKNIAHELTQLDASVAQVTGVPIAVVNNPPHFPGQPGAI